MNLKLLFKKLAPEILFDYLFVTYKKIKIHFKTEIPENERILIETIGKYLKPNDTVIDIGAHIGTFSLGISKYLNKNGKIFAFEPNIKSYYYLNKICKKVNNIKTYNFGFSDKEDTLEMVFPDGANYSAGAAIMKTASHLNNKNEYEKIIINTKIFDRFFNNQKIKLIKCDVEGHELEVLSGAKKNISKYKPIIIVEILREKWIDNDPKKAIISKMLISLGYKIAQISNNEVNFKSFDINDENFLFFPLK